MMIVKDDSSVLTVCNSTFAQYLEVISSRFLFKFFLLLGIVIMTKEAQGLVQIRGGQQKFDA